MRWLTLATIALAACSDAGTAEPWTFDVADMSSDQSADVGNDDGSDLELECPTHPAGVVVYDRRLPGGPLCVGSEMLEFSYEGQQFMSRVVAEDCCGAEIYDVAVSDVKFETVGFRMEDGTAYQQLEPGVDVTEDCGVITRERPNEHRPECQRCEELEYWDLRVSAKVANIGNRTDTVVCFTGISFSTVVQPVPPRHIAISTELIREPIEPGEVVEIDAVHRVQHYEWGCTNSFYLTCGGINEPELYVSFQSEWPNGVFEIIAPPTEQL